MADLSSMSDADLMAAIQNHPDLQPPAASPPGGAQPAAAAPAQPQQADPEGISGAFQSGFAHGATFGLTPNRGADLHPIASAAGNIIGSIMGGEAEVKVGLAVARAAGAGPVIAKVGSALAVRNLLRLSGVGALSAGTQGATQGAVEGAQTGGVPGAAAGAAAGGALGAVAGAVAGPVGAGGIKVVQKGVDVAKDAATRGLKLFADKIDMPLPQLQQLMADFKASTGRNASIADILDAKSKANLKDDIQSSQASHAAMLDAAANNEAALPGAVQSQLKAGAAFPRPAATTQTPFAPSPVSTSEVGKLQNARKVAADLAMEPIRGTQIPLDANSKDVLLTQIMPNVPLKRGDKFVLNDEIANDHITLGTLDMLRQKLSAIKAADPASIVGSLADDVRDFARNPTVNPAAQQYGQMLDDYAAHSRFINGFQHAEGGGTLASAEQPLRADLETDEGKAGLELGARTRMVNNAATERGAQNTINTLRQPTAGSTNFSPAERASQESMARAHTVSQENYSDLSGGTLKSKESETAAKLRTTGEAAFAALGVHATTGFKVHAIGRFLMGAGIRESTARALVDTLTSRDPQRLAQLPGQITQYRLTQAQRRTVLAAASKLTGRPVGAFAAETTQ